MTIDIEELRRIAASINSPTDQPRITAALNALPDLLAVFDAAERFGKIAGLPFGDYTNEYRVARSDLAATVRRARGAT